MSTANEFDLVMLKRGNREGYRFPLRRFVYRLGSQAGVDICFRMHGSSEPAAAVQPLHAVLTVDPPDVYVQPAFDGCSVVLRHSGGGAPVDADPRVCTRVLPEHTVSLGAVRFRVVRAGAPLSACTSCACSQASTASEARTRAEDDAQSHGNGESHGSAAGAAVEPEGASREGVAEKSGGSREEEDTTRDGASRASEDLQKPDVSMDGRSQHEEAAAPSAAPPEMEAAAPAHDSMPPSQQSARPPTPTPVPEPERREALPDAGALSPILPKAEPERHEALPDASTLSSVLPKPEPERQDRQQTDSAPAQRSQKPQTIDDVLAMQDMQLAYKPSGLSLTARRRALHQGQQQEGSSQPAVLAEDSSRKRAHSGNGDGDEAGSQQSATGNDEPLKKRARVDERRLTEADVAAFNDFIHKADKHRRTKQFIGPDWENFKAPGLWGAEYIKEIANPMCVSWMRGKMRDGQYSTLRDVEADVDLIVDNCFKFNCRPADHEIRECAKYLKKLWRRAVSSSESASEQSEADVDYSQSSRKYLTQAGGGIEQQKKSKCWRESEQLQLEWSRLESRSMKRKRH
eukprot:m51a1_g5492 hypothetical protein (573) ;mRNA; f:332760-334825